MVSTPPVRAGESILDWTGNPRLLNIDSTPHLSMTAELTEEMNGVIGDPPSEPAQWEDRRNATRIYRWMSHDKKILHEHTQQQPDFPAVTSFMLDRDGYVDGAGRASGGGNMDNIEAGLRHLIQFYADLDVNDMFVGDNERSDDKRESYVKALKQYTVELQRLSRINRLAVKAVVRAVTRGHAHTSPHGLVVNYEHIPSGVRSDVHNYVEHNQEFLAALTDQDWQYIAYLVQENPTGPSGELTTTQQVIREYLGTPADLRTALMLMENGDTRSSRDTSSVAYAAFAHKLASTLIKRNFQDIQTHDISPNVIPPVMSEFEDRSRGLFDSVALGY